MKLSWNLFWFIGLVCASSPSEGKPGYRAEDLRQLPALPIFTGKPQGTTATWSVAYSNGSNGPLLNVVAEQAPLIQIMEEIVRKTGIQIRGLDKLQGDISIRFSGLALEQGLVRLLAGVDHVFSTGHATNGSGSPMKVLILRTRKTNEAQESVSGVAQPQKDEIRISADEQEKAESAAIETALQAPDPKVRMEAVAALGNTANRQAVEPLVSALADEHAEVRGQAADALMAIGDVQAVENLARLLTGDEDTQVRRRAAEALLRIQDQESLDSSDTALQALQDQDPLVRMSVIDTLGALGNPQGVKPLALALKDADQTVRLSAVNALRMIGGQEARALLEQALGDGDVEVGKNAAEALSALEEMEEL